MTLTEFLLARVGEDIRVYGGHQHGLRRKLAKHLLRDAEAKRGIVELLSDPLVTSDDGLAPSLAAIVLGDLAGPYAYHPDYRDEWAT